MNWSPNGVKPIRDTIELADYALVDIVWERKEEVSGIFAKSCVITDSVSAAGLLITFSIRCSTSGLHLPDKSLTDACF